MNVDSCARIRYTFAKFTTLNAGALVMHTLTADEIVAQVSRDVLMRVVERVLLALANEGRKRQRAEMPVYGPDAGNVIGWFRSVDSEVALMEASAGLQEAIRSGAASHLLPTDYVVAR